jgi:hypothetical protein
MSCYKKTESVKCGPNEKFKYGENAEKVIETIFIGN